MSYGIRKVWCWTFTQHTSFYLTSNVTDMNYITHERFFVYLYQPIHWYFTRILTFLSEQRAPFSTMFAFRAFHNVIWSQHSSVQVSIFVTCLNFAGTGSRLWHLYVAFVMTWYLAFKTSGRTAKAVRPVISDKLLLVVMKKKRYNIRKAPHMTRSNWCHLKDAWIIRIYVFNKTVVIWLQKVFFALSNALFTICWYIYENSILFEKRVNYLLLLFVLFFSRTTGA